MSTMLQVPSPATVVRYTVVVVVVPSVTDSEMCAPTSPVPLAEVVVALPMLTGSVTAVMATAGTTVSLSAA